MKLFGTWHNGTSEEINAVADLIAKEVAASKSDNVVVALEPNKKWINRVPFDGEHLPFVVSLKHALYERRNIFGEKKIQLVGLDTSKGDRVAMKTVKNAFFVDPRHTQKGNYVIDHVRTKVMAKSIKRIKPEVVLVGGIHALLLGRMLKVKPQFVLATRAEMLAHYKSERANYLWIVKERAAKRRMRKNLVLRRKNKK